MRISATSLALLFALASLANAQKTATLAQSEAQLRLGQLTEARSILAQWKKDHPTATTSSEAGARAAYLAARLATTAADAEDNYLNVAISAPSSSPYVPEALLRVGQAEMARGAARNAIPYLQRLVENYPKSDFVQLGREWLARAQAALPTENSTARAAKPVVTPSKQPAANTARFAVQVAAFRERSNARAIARSVAQAGFTDVRMVTVPINELTRVRVGHFATEAAAADVLKRLQSAGYKPAIVPDVQNEQIVRD